jgi:la-related protein 1
VLNTNPSGEKTKWVAIPAEELQAAADALHASTRPRNQWHKQGNGSRNNQTSGSGSGQGPSRSHSGRNSLSHSVSQSQAHSRTGSVQSSPPRATRAKKLPTEDPVGGRNNTSAVTGSTDTSPHPPGDSTADGGEPSPTPPTAAHGPGHLIPVPPIPITMQGPSYSQDQQQISLPSPSYNPSGYAPAPPPSHLPAASPTYQLYPPYKPFEQGQSYSHYVSEQHRPPYPPTLPSQPVQQPVVPGANPYLGADAPQDGQVESPITVPDKRTQQVVFGSIGLPGSSKGPPPQPMADNEKRNETKNDEDGLVEKRAKTFSVGLIPGESGPSRVTKGRKRLETVPTRSASNDVPQKDVQDDADRSVIDLTRKEIETEWEFGSIKYDDNITDGDALSEPVPPPSPPLPAPSSPADPSQPHIQTGNLNLQHGGQLASPINILPLAAPFPVHRAAIPMPVTEGTAGGGSEWEVKDYGFGFGHSGPPNVPFEERDREREWADMERERERQERERDYNGRPRRGSYGSGGYSGYDRGNYGGRRGRGMNAGFSGGRGYHPRGGRGVYQSQQQRQAPFTITPPPQFQPLSTHNDLPSAYYAPPRPPLATYIPTSYDSYQVPPPVSPPSTNMPPVPVPLSVLSFPLDPTRWYLLGQLEYYLSPQNMAQDFFLRQKVTLFIFIL